MKNSASVVCATIFGLTLVHHSQAHAESYVISPATPSYEHFVRGGVNVSPISNTYTVEVPSGYTAKVHVKRVSAQLVHCESGSVTYLVNGMPTSLASTNTLKASGMIGLSVMASQPSVSWTEMYIDSYMTIAGVLTPHYSHRYHYYDTYYYDYRYVITADYITPVTVSFESNGGGVIPDQSYWSSEPYGVLPTPVRSGYKFKGWYSDPAFLTGVTASTKVSPSVKKLYAKWAAYHSVGFEANGGNPVSAQTYVLGEEFGVLPLPVRFGYKFIGWYSNPSLTDKVVATSIVDEDITLLYAKWSELVTVWFNSNGGDAVSSREYVVGETYGALPTPTWAAHTFQGWHSDPGLLSRVDSTDIVAASVSELYAKWTENHPSFTIDESGTLTKAVLNGCSDIVLPDTVKSIGASAFLNCTSMRTIIMPGVTNISQSSFSGCGSLTSIRIPEGLTEIPYGAFKDCGSLRNVEIPESVRSIGSYAFDNCTSAYDTETIPGVRLVDGWACGYTSSLSGALDLTRCRGISASAFRDCTRISSVYIPNVPIGGWTFRGCTGLISVSFDDNIRELPYMMFCDCVKLTNVTLPKCLESVPEWTFGRDSIGDIREITGCLIPSIEIPDAVTKIGGSAFCYCKRLTSITIPRNVREVGVGAFQGCSALTTLRIYANDLVLEQGAFYYYPQPAATTIYIYGENWPTGSRYLFQNQTTSTGQNNSCRVYARALLKSKPLPEWITGAGLSVTYLAAETVEVTFDSCGGSEVAARTYTEGEAYGVLPTPVREGYVFQGWKSKNGALVKTTDVASPFDNVLSAVWSPMKNTLTLDRQDGDGGSFVVTATFGENLPDIPTQRRIDFVFEGYWSEPGGKGVQYYTKEGKSIKTWSELADRRLYASWAEKQWDIADYLNNDMGLPFVSMGDAEWIPDCSLSHDGVASMRSGAIGASSSVGELTKSVMTTTVLGEGTGSFWWKVDCEPSYYNEYYDYAVFLVDGAEVARIAGEMDWAKVDYVLSGAGGHVLMWMFVRDDFDEPGIAYANCAWVDEFEWSPKEVSLTFDSNGATEGPNIQTVTRYEGFALVLPGEGVYSKTMCSLQGWSDGETVYAPGETYVLGPKDVTLTAVWRELSWTLAEAVDAADIVLTTGGDADWIVDSSEFKKNMVSLRSGAITHSQETWVEVIVCGAGELSFWWKVSGEVNRSRIYDYAKVTLDGVQLYASGDTDWVNLTVPVSGPGEHTIRWTYLKNASVDSGLDCAWLDEVSWTPSGMFDPIPELSSTATAAEVSSALQGSDDARLAENVTDAATYNAYRDWALKIGAAEVKASPFAWASFATDSAALLAKMPTDDDLKVEEFKPSAMAGSFDFTVSVKDVKIGDKASVDNLKKLFGLEGAESLDTAAFSSENVSLDFKEPQDGKLKFSATPAVDNAKSFFMKAKVK